MEYVQTRLIIVLMLQALLYSPVAAASRRNKESWYSYAQDWYSYAQGKYTKFEDACGSKTVAYGIAGAATAVGAVVVGLPVLGFGTAGVAAGSVASTVQAAVAGGVGAGIFGALQSAGAAGLSVTTKVILGSVGGYFGAKTAQKSCAGTGKTDCTTEELEE